MFMAHELHPFSKTERFSVMMCYLCWAFFITVVFEEVTYTKCIVINCSWGVNRFFNGFDLEFSMKIKSYARAM